MLHLRVDDIKAITGNPEWKKCFRSPSHQTIQSNRNYWMFWSVLLNIFRFNISDLFWKHVYFCKVAFTLARKPPGHDMCCVTAICLCTVDFLPTHFSPRAFGYPNSALSQQETLIICCKGCELLIEEMSQFLCGHRASIITCTYKIRYFASSYSSTAFKSQQYVGINNFKRLKHYLRCLKGNFSSKNWIALTLADKRHPK